MMGAGAHRWSERSRSVATAILVTYAARLLLALAIGWPFARLLADPTLALARGDRVLFEDGAVYLAEALRQGRTQLSAFAEGSVAAWLLIAYLGLLPLAALLVTLTERRWLAGRVLAGRAFAAFGPLSVLLGLAIIAAAFGWVFPMTAFRLIEGKLSERFGDVGVDLVQIVFRVGAAALVTWVGVMHDLARAAVVRDDVGALPAVILAWSTVQDRGFTAYAGWALRAVSGLLLVGGVALGCARLGVETAGRFATVLVAHQLVALALVGLRASWLARALELLPTRTAMEQRED